MVVGAMVVAGPAVAQASTLSSLAASMQPDTWAVLNTTGIGGTTLLAQGASGNITSDASEGCWDPVAQRAHFVGMDHQPGTVQRHVAYDAASNTWIRLADPPFGGGSINHGWESTSCDPNGRMLYRMNIGSLTLWRYSFASGQWTSLGAPPAGVLSFPSGFPGLAWNSARNQLIIAGEESGTSGAVVRYDPATSSFARLSASLLSGFTNSVSFAEYSEVHKITLFGGDASTAWKMDAQGGISATAPFPACTPRINRDGIIHADPATGNFVMLCGQGSASWHVYNPVANAWITKPTPSSVPNHILNISSNTGTWPTWGTIGIPILDHGVIFYVKCTVASCGVRLYKGGPFTAPPPPAADTQPPSVSLTTPGSGAGVTGTILVSASAADNVTVAGVQFRLDGANLGPERPAPPYTIAWNTATAGNGSHTLTAVARDLAGNVATAGPITVTVSNSGTSGGSGPPPAAAGLVAAYSLDTGSGATAVDSSGNGNSGTITGATWTTGGRFGNALAFNGSSSFVTVPDAAALDLGSTGTIEAWVKLNTLGKWHGVIAKGDANRVAAHNYALEITNADRVVCNLGNGATGMTVESTITVVTGRFYHLACTWNGTTLALFVDGALETSGPQNLTVTGNTTPLFIGQFGGNVDRLDGTIDEVRLYNRGLTAAEIQAEASAGAAVVAAETAVVGSVLPSSRSVTVGQTATAFAAMINVGTVPAQACGLALGAGLTGTFSYQVTDPRSNQLQGAMNTPVDIPPGALQTYVFAITPQAPLAPTDIPIQMGCANSVPASVQPGVNTLLLSASTAPGLDVVAIGATLSGDGIVTVPGPGATGIFAVAASNVGVDGAVAVTADTRGVPVPVEVTLCETETATGACKAPPTSAVSTFLGANTTASFAVFVRALAPVPFEPGANRIYVRFQDATGVVRGATSVAVRTP